MNIRYRGEEVWLGDTHIANIRVASEHLLPFIVQHPDGEIRFAAKTRKTAELWAGVHSEELLPHGRPPAN